MSLSPQEVIEAIESEGRKLGKLVDELTAAANDNAQAEVAWKYAAAKRRLEYKAENPKATVQQIEDYALLACESEYRHHLAASATLTVLRDSLRASTSRLDALRTIITSIRAAGG